MFRRVEFDLCLVRIWKCTKKRGVLSGTASEIWWRWTRGFSSHVGIPRDVKRTTCLGGWIIGSMVQCKERLGHHFIVVIFRCISKFDLFFYRVQTWGSTAIVERLMASLRFYLLVFKLMTILHSISPPPCRSWHLRFLPSPNFLPSSNHSLTVDCHCYQDVPLQQVDVNTTRYK